MRLPSGEVLLSGGFLLAGGTLQGLQSAERFLPGAGSFSAITTGGGGLATMSDPRGYHAATLLDDGRVLLTGGLSRTVCHAGKLHRIRTPIRVLSG